MQGTTLSSSNDSPSNNRIQAAVKDSIQCTRTGTLVRSADGIEKTEWHVQRYPIDIFFHIEENIRFQLGAKRKHFFRWRNGSKLWSYDPLCPVWVGGYFLGPDVLASDPPFKPSLFTSSKWSSFNLVPNASTFSDGEMGPSYGLMTLFAHKFRGYNMLVLLCCMLLHLVVDAPVLAKALAISKLLVMHFHCTLLL